jgi:hypothetical protein
VSTPEPNQVIGWENGLPNNAEKTINKVLWRNNFAGRIENIAVIIIAFKISY